MVSSVLSWFGLDVSKNTFDVSVLIGETVKQSKSLPCERFTRDESGVDAFLKWSTARLKAKGLSIETAGVVMEATGKYSQQLAKMLLKAAAWSRVCIVNPRDSSYFQKSLGFRCKTDRVDAKALAYFGRNQQPRPYQSPSKIYAQIKELTRCRKKLVDKKVGLKLSLAEAEAPAAKAVMSELIVGYEEQIATLNEEIDKLIMGDDRIRDCVALMETIPGVARVTSSVVIAEMGDLGDYETSRQIAAMAGLPPEDFESGTSVKKRAAMSKKGSPYVRHALFNAVRSMLTVKRSHLKDTYEHMKARGKPGKVIFGAMMRKTLVLMRALVISGQAYDPSYRAV